jgi:hypothetical protein
MALDIVIDPALPDYTGQDIWAVVPSLTQVQAQRQEELDAGDCFFRAALARYR